MSRMISNDQRSPSISTEALSGHPDRHVTWRFAIFFSIIPQLHLHYASHILYSLTRREMSNAYTSKGESHAIELPPLLRRPMRGRFQILRAMRGWQNRGDDTPRGLVGCGPRACRTAQQDPARTHGCGRLGRAIWYARR